MSPLRCRATGATSCSPAICAIASSTRSGAGWDGLRAACEGDFVIALYNPASRARPAGVVEAFDLLRRLKTQATPVAFARAVGRADEQLTLTTLGAADASLADMATLVVVGSSETRFIARDGGRPWMVTPRAYGARR